MALLATSVGTLWALGNEQKEDRERRGRSDAAFVEGGRISKLVDDHANNKPANRSSNPMCRRERAEGEVVADGTAGRVQGFVKLRGFSFAGLAAFAELFLYKKQSFPVSRMWQLWRLGGKQ